MRVLFRDLREAHKRKEISTADLRRAIVGRVQDLPRPPGAAVFEEELLMIGDEALRAFVPTVLDRLPNYFWHIPASVVGFHDHPEDNELGGLVSHCRRVARMTRLVLEPYGVERHADDLVVAALLHDGLKYGWTGDDLGDVDHAVFAAAWLERDGLFDDRPQIREMVRTHLGRWGRVLPRNALEWAFHMADFLVSRGLDVRT